MHGCIGNDDSTECRAVHEVAACGWLRDHSYVWDNFIPDHAHCSFGQRVEVTGGGDEATCVPCEPGRFQGRRSNLKQCQPCPPGTYRYRSRLFPMGECMLCGKGRYQDRPGGGAGGCKACPAG